MATVIEGLEYWSYLVPYIDVELDEQTGLISGEFDIIIDQLWQTFGYEGSTEDGDLTVVSVNSMSDTTIYNDYNIVNGNTPEKGSFPMKVVGHDLPLQPLRAPSALGGYPAYYQAILSIGDISLPTYLNLEGDRGSGLSLETDTGILINYDYSYDVSYSSEEEERLKQDYEKYSTEKEYGTFSEALNGFLLNIGNEMHNQTNGTKETFILNKTDKRNLLPKNYYALADLVADNEISISATTPTDTSGLSTTDSSSGFTDADSAIIEASSPVASTGGYA